MSRRGVRRLALLAVLAFGAAWAVPRVARAQEAREPAAERAGVATEAVTSREGIENGAEEHETPHVDGGKLALQLVNFGILVFILAWFGGRAINKALLARHQQLKADLAAASEARAAAEKRVAEQDKRLASLESEIVAMRAGIKQEAEDEKQRLIATAEERAKSIGEETKFLLDQQVKEAEATLRREVAEAAVKIAEQLVTRSLNAADQQRFVNSFVTDVATPPGRGA